MLLIFRKVIEVQEKMGMKKKEDRRGEKIL
jgi:hypothetical protein